VLLTEIHSIWQMIGAVAVVVGVATFIEHWHEKLRAAPGNGAGHLTPPIVGVLLGFFLANIIISII
jgi:hypothetical protein